MSNKAEVKKIIAQELHKCKHDPVYFMRKYCYIQHPQRGRIIFTLYPFQEKVLYLFRDHQNIITLKSRQLGISTLAAGYALWLMVFHKDKNVLALATTQATARNLVTKVIFMYDNLPKWLQIPYTEKNKLSIRLTNGSRAIAKSSNEDAARSEAVSLLILDEAAFIDNIDRTFAAAQQTLATGGQCLALSTPNGVGNWFYRTWKAAELRENSFVPVKLPWSVHPERDQLWRDQQDADLGKEMAAQECDCDFLTSGMGVFKPEYLNWYAEHSVCEPLEKRGIDGNYWVWDYVDYGKTYMVSVDVARGDSSDFSAITVWDIETSTQVAGYKGNMPPRDLGNLAVAIGTEWNTALIVCDNRNIGWSTIEQIIERSYRNLYHSTPNRMENVESYLQKMDHDRLQPGLNITSANRNLMVAKGMEYVRDRIATIKDVRLLNEMRVFIWSSGKAEAESGNNDDMVLTYLQYCYVRDNAIRLHQQGIDLQRSTMNAMYAVNQRTHVNNVAPINNNPYIMKNPRGQNEDLTWLLK